MRGGAVNTKGNFYCLTDSPVTSEETRKSQSKNEDNRQYSAARYSHLQCMSLWSGRSSSVESWQDHKLACSDSVTRKVKLSSNMVIFLVFCIYARA